MTPVRNAVRSGIYRGWTEFIQSLRSPQDQGFYLFTALAILGYLFLNQHDTIEFAGSSLSFPTVALPSILGGLVAFGMIIGPSYALAMEREDGTLLRARAVPYGVVGHVSGHVVANLLGLIPSFAVILIPGFIIFDGLMPPDAGGWGMVLWVTLLGTLATMPIGMVIGSLVPGIQKVGTWGMLPFILLLAISGIFAPVQDLWGWVQPIAQAFPIYWLGLGMRAAFLPAAAAALEIGGTWRTLETALVLGAWAVAGLMVAPFVLRRMARRQSGSQVEAAREQAMQWVR
jgi:ABC-2 type transport system permease protein